MIPENINKHPDLLSMKTVIRTKDFEASKTFYTQLLKLEVVEEYDDGDGSRGCIMRVGPEGSTAFVELSEIAEGHYYFNRAFHQSFTNDKADIQIKTNAVNYWADRLKQHNWEARGPVLRPWGSHYLYLRDPDGLQLIIYEERKETR